MKMKKSFSIILILVLLVSGLLMFAGCGKEEEGKKEENKKPDLSAYAGTYEGKYTKVVGDTDDNRNEDEEFSLDLKADGTGKHNRDGMSFNVTWTVDGENFSMSETFIGDPIEYTGTLKNGKLDIFNGDPDEIFTYEYVYEIE